MTTSSVERFVTDFGQVEAVLPGAGAAAVARLRREALERLRETGLPDTRDEDWKYTSVAGLDRRAFRPSALLPAPSAEAVEALLAAHALPDALRLVFVNGRLDAARSTLEALPEGLEVRPLGVALADVADELPVAANGFDALNRAFLTDGAHIRLAEGLTLGRPLQLLFLCLPGAEAPAIHQAVLLDLGRGASASLIESHLGAGEGEALVTSLTRVRAGAGSRLERLKIEAGPRRGFHVGRSLIEQGRDSTVIDHSVSFGAALARHDIQVNLGEPGAACTLNGLYLADGRRHVDHHTRIDHLAPHTTSEELYKGVLDGAGRAVFNGKVVVHPGADKTSARQANHNLLLSANAEIDTKPELEILADDVQCAHGATVGQLDETALFYLRSRAIDEPTARGFLTYAFAAEALGRIGVASAREQLRAGLVALLKAPAVLGEPL